jgi:hypothetical protein
MITLERGYDYVVPDGRAQWELWLQKRMDRELLEYLEQSPGKWCRTWKEAVKHVKNGKYD